MIPPEPPVPAPPSRREAFWDYHDLFALFGLLFLTVVLFARTANLYLILVIQLAIYAVGLGCIALILRLRYGQPFWRSLAWIRPRSLNALLSFLLGPFVAVSLSYVGILLHAHPSPMPFEKQLNNPTLAVLYGALVVLAGPLFEELVFRGFMMPLLIRSVGVAAGILITAALFGALHGFQQADWRVVVLISCAGAAFGWRRYVTGSTVDSTLMHVGFNLAPFLALFHR